MVACQNNTSQRRTPGDNNNTCICSCVLLAIVVLFLGCCLCWVCYPQPKEDPVVDRCRCCYCLNFSDCEKTFEWLGSNVTRSFYFTSLFLAQRIFMIPVLEITDEHLGSKAFAVCRPPFPGSAQYLPGLHNPNNQKVDKYKSPTCSAHLEIALACLY